MANKETEIPKARNAHLFKMAARMAVQQGKKYLSGDKNRRLLTMLEQAETLVSHVGKLKGAAMKAVQTLSIEGYDFLPPEVIQVLEKLQSQAPPISSAVLKEQMLNELGEEKFSLLKNLSEEPIASASIGQVYSAEYQGQPVVIKIQYPGVAESVDADIDTLKKLLKALIVVSQKNIKLDSLMEEARRVLKLETDYKHEEKSLIQYKKLFAGSEYIIPNVFPEFTTSKVLVMSRERGLEYTDWVKTDPSDKQRQKVAAQLLRLYNKEFFENRLVQTDPNPANFLVTEQGDMVLLDFGATIDFDEDFVRDYQLLIRKVFARDREEILKKIYDLNFLDPRESKEVQKAFVDFMILSLTPFDPALQPFDFGDPMYSQEIRNEALSFSRKLKYSAPPKKLIFLHRKLGGIFMLLKKLDIKVDLSEFREIILDRDFFKAV